MRDNISPGDWDEWIVSRTHDDPNPPYPLPDDHEAYWTGESSRQDAYDLEREAACNPLLAEYASASESRRAEIRAELNSWGYCGELS